jgi:hypothetical protein
VAVCHTHDLIFNNNNNNNNSGPLMSYGVIHPDDESHNWLFVFSASLVD